MIPSTATSLLAKVRDDYDRIAADFSATRDRLWPEMEAWRQHFRPGQRVLDAGCGNGRAFALVAGQGIEYEGVDVSSGLIAAAKSRVTDILATFRVASVETLPFHDNEFDIVIMASVLHHVPSERLRLVALREVWRVLKPGGRLLMTNWDLSGNKYFWPRLKARTKRLFGADFDAGDVLIPWNKGQTVDRYCHAFTTEELSDLLNRAGFTVEQNDYSTPSARGSRNIVTVASRRE